MRRHQAAVLVLDGSGHGTDLATQLTESGWESSHVATLDAAATALDERAVDLVCCGTPDDGDVIAGIETVTRVAPTTPVVALVDPETDVTATAVLDAGAVDAVCAAGPTDEWYPLLTRRLDAAHSTVPESLSRAVIDRLAAERDGLICLFDENRRHHIVAGGTDDEAGLDPGRFDGTTLDAVGLDPAVSTQLRANYHAACDGETRSRTVQLDGQLFTVETEPIGPAEAGFGLATYAPAATAEAFGADDETTRARVDRLHETVAALDDRSEVDAVCEFVVERAVELFAADACGIAELDEGVLASVAATAERPYQFDGRLEAGDGLAGRTIERQETIAVADVTDEFGPENGDELDSEDGDELDLRRADEFDAGTTPYRSVLSIPMGPDGVFQLFSTEVDAFAPVDRVLCELLVAYATHAVARVRFERALTRERDRFAALFQNIPDAAIQYEVVDGEPTIESVNSAFVRLFGFEPDVAVGSSVVETVVPADERDDARRLYDEVLEGNRVDAEVDRLTDDGVAPFLLRSVPIPADGDDQHGYFIYTDISTLVQREQELERQNERLDAFASIVSHDLRNPLSIAEGYLQTAIESGDVDNLTIVDEELDRMRRMIEDLLTLARDGEAIGALEPVELATVVEAAWGGVDTADGSLTIGSLPTVEGDPDRLRQLFENLFRNAALHGGDDVAVDVDTFDEGIYVADDGPGVPDDLKDEILDAGVSTAKGDGGTGFGLAIVTQIASAHGWTVTVEDSTSGGARFELRLQPDEDSQAGAPTGAVR
ncbi:multi-sensor signal transduction histidine kinase [Halovivax asiaticus JCM 14624]|uniref:histidine kinase n=1 Tax=Halovivax asiaticus JCM 14624 TaxID=1227490 RepID=M0BR49_9EURY|nr:ATP-binding protein [Halovivax asiaticus]ELZ12159.1 multi-sensor signal transduction histidine kinase [Halovivax asiaticus JCM 14624]